MSLIESAIAKARKVVHGSAVRTSPGAQNSAMPRRIPAERRVGGADSPKPVRQYPLCATDAVRMEENRILPQISDRAALRAYKIMRTRLLQRLAQNNWQSLAVTGTDTGQGKTLTAINLAIALAQDPNTSVILVDLDLQRPMIGTYMGMTFQHGLGEYLTGEAELDQIIYSPGIERLAVIPNSISFEHSSERLSGPRMLELESFIQAESPQRIVIYDMPPLLLSDDVLTFAPQVDGILLVVSEGFTTRNALKKSKEILAEMNLIGVVLNRSTERDDAAYYY
jgi:Mrp family chromosome partitioning ATPase